MSRSSENRAIDAGSNAELVASLFATRAPAIIMTLLFLMVGTIVARTVNDAALDALIAGGLIASLVRIAVMIAGERALARLPSPPVALDAIERRFAISYLAFAGIFGSFCARAIMVAPVEQLILIGILMTGYAAGVASGVTLRPRIAVVAIALGTLPSATIAGARLGMIGLPTTVMLLALLVGGLRSMQVRYRQETGRIALRRTYERLARQDYLTRIANRLGLEQHYADRASAGDDRPVVIHCLDLDGFKQVNDRHGHDVGDALLIAVAARLADGPGEAIAARLGGDEFVLVQFDAAAADVPESLEERLARPYHVDGHLLEIGVSIGTATGSIRHPLRDLLREADLRQRLRKLERRRLTRGDAAATGHDAETGGTTVPADGGPAFRRPL
jgi:diguanylate cyclase (GGDEF)-like protein